MAWDFFPISKHSEITPKDMSFNITSEISQQVWSNITYKVSPVLKIKLKQVTENNSYK